MLYELISVYRAQNKDVSHFRNVSLFVICLCIFSVCILFMTNKHHTPQGSVCRLHTKPDLQHKMMPTYIHMSCQLIYYERYNIIHSMQ